MKTMHSCKRRVIVQLDKGTDGSKFTVKERPDYVCLVLNQEKLDKNILVHGESIFLLSGIHDWSINMNTLTVRLHASVKGDTVVLLNT